MPYSLSVGMLAGVAGTALTILNVCVAEPSSYPGNVATPAWLAVIVQLSVPACTPVTTPADVTVQSDDAVE